MAPAVSLRKHAIQNPILPGLPHKTNVMDIAAVKTPTNGKPAFSGIFIVPPAMVAPIFDSSFRGKLNKQKSVLQYHLFMDIIELI